MRNPAGQIGQIVTQDSFTRVLSHVRHYHPDLVILTGDLSQDGSPEAYRRLSTILDGVNCPVLAIPGNHDSPWEMARHLKPPVIQKPVFQWGNWRFIALDSRQAHSPSGRLRPEHLWALQNQLAGSPARPTVIYLHHPPVPVGHPSLDIIRLENAGILRQFIASIPGIKLILCGHVHLARTRRVGHVPCLTCPSTCVRFPPGDLPIAHAGWRTLSLYPDGRTTNHLHWLNPAPA